MSGKQKSVFGSAVIIVIILAVAGVLWHSHQHNRQLAAARLADQTSSAAADSGNSSLSVNGGGADDLGQLQNNDSQSQNSSDSSSGSDVNPATFSQYNKYQNSQDALFGTIQTGSGAELTAGHKASMYYKGWLTNGAMIDQSPVSSAGQPQPYSFTLGSHQIIPGLEEGTAGMKAGGKRLIIVPPALGYGSQGQGAVPPNAVLVFEVQLLSVQ